MTEPAFVQEKEENTPLFDERRESSSIAKGM